MADPARLETACRTHRPFRRNNNATRATAGLCAIAALCLTVAGACWRKQDPAVLFDSANRHFQQGEFAAAKQQAFLGRRKFQHQAQSEWFWKFTLLLAEIDLWNGDTKEADRLLAQAPPAQYYRLRIQYQILRSYSLFRSTKDVEAESAVEAAAAEAHKRGAWDLEADAGLLLGSRLLADSIKDRGETALQNALRIASDHHLEYDEMAALLDLGVLRYEAGLYGDAIPYFERADELAKQLGATAAHRMAVENASSCYRDIGDADRALKTQLEVVAAEENKGLPTTRSNAYIDLGATYLLQRDSARAIACFRKAVACVKPSEAPAHFVASASSLAQALELTGAVDEAERYNESAFRVCDPRNKDQLAQLSLNKAHIAQHRMRYQDAIAAYRDAFVTHVGTPSLRWEAHAGLASVYAITGDRAQAHAQFELALQIIEQNRFQQVRTDYQITFLTNLIRFYQEYVELLISEGEVTRALEVADSSRASVLTRSFVGQQPGQSRDLIAVTQKTAAQTGSIFLFYWLAPQRSYVWVIRAHDVNAIALPSGEKVTRQVESFRSLLIDEKQDVLAGASTVGQRLYDTLIGPIQGFLAADSHVVIVPDGPLHELNFEMLVSGTPKPHYWIEDAVVSVAPSLNILRQGAPVEPRTRSLLLMGDPEPAPGYAKLPQAAIEMEDVERYFPRAAVTVSRGAQATVDAYRTAAPDRFSTVHFATHAEANEQSPLDSAIILSPVQNAYKLYARDVMGMPLKADLVTISACRGAGARTLSGEGPVGLAWAFLQAGARNVVTSLWDVNDRSTADLMDRFYSGVESGKPYALALRDAKLSIRSSHSKPYFWAPFQLYTRTISRN